MNDDIPCAAVLSAVPMLCTRCAALAGCWMTHHRIKATAAQPRTVLSFTAASLEAQSSPLCQLFLILTRNRLGWGPSRGPAVRALTAVVCPKPRGATHVPE